ncbi:chorismate mutase [Choiromyces venosus 120613-1]|uniref:Chorismate mutase n=1 Tax=Choiromyces venosus 120613-1 TaxID=1336337 RepID=A0A3N4JUN9_9PEZI|nr:chorismate mutase [Choiromyces venosus 120613-1]
MEDTIDLTDPRSALDLSNIRYQLIRLEDTIIFHLIERVQFPLNPTIYMAGAITIPNFHGSFLDYILMQQEMIHALVRRYQAPDEYAFFPDLIPEPILAPLKYPQLLHPNTINFNDELKTAYIKHILPAACRPQAADRGEQYENYGSTAVNDVACLQALSRRIHFGKFVAEAKFRAEKEKFTDLINRRDIDGITKEITNEAVEKQVLRRLELKARTYGTNPGDSSKDPKVKINIDAVVAMYKDYVIPMTKEVEVGYLLQRLTNPTPETAAENSH